MRWTPDGVLEFIGRLDNQVKLRATIELDEIAAVLGASPRRTGRRTMREDRADDARLVAYVVAAPPESGTRAAAHMEAELPTYMVPIRLGDPRRPPADRTGKVDRAALPAPEPATGGGEATAPRPPAGHRDRRAVGVLVEVLGIPAVGADDNFFDLEGTSLQAVLVLTRLADLLGVTVAVRAVYGAGSCAPRRPRGRAAGRRRACGRRPPRPPTPLGPPAPGRSGTSSSRSRA